MGLFSKWFSNQSERSDSAKEGARRLAGQMHERLLTHTGRPMLSFEILEDEAGIFESKLGGAYYIPEGDTPPTNVAGDPLYLLVQLNFQELPHLDLFPEQGLLQIFIDGHDDVYGLNFDAPANQDNWCVRFLPTIPAEAAAAQVFEPAWEEDITLPLLREGAFRLKATLSQQAITSCDWQVSDAIKTYCGDLLPETFQSVYDLDDDVFVSWNDLCEPPVCQMGGYPTFTQYDLREDVPGAPELLLFQLDTCDYAMWGDSGVGNFFICRDALKNQDFSHVWFNWDCY